MMTNTVIGGKCKFWSTLGSSLTGVLVEAKLKGRITILSKQSGIHEYIHMLLHSILEMVIL